MYRNDWPVGDYGIRPNGSPNHCFYCSVERGHEHKMGCVMRQRSVVVRTVIEHVILVPEDWDVDLIEFQRNESSRCTDETIKELNGMAERLDEAGLCTCDLIATTFLREATEDDEAACATKVADTPT